MVALLKEVKNMLVLPTVGNANNYLVYIVGLHADKGKAKTHLGQNFYSVVESTLLYGTAFGGLN